MPRHRVQACIRRASAVALRPRAEQCPENNKDMIRRLQRQLTATRPGNIAWLGAIAVVLLQLQLATHHNLVDHDALTESGESCEVCVKLDSNGKAPTDTRPLIEVPREPATVLAAERPSTRAIRGRTHSARAPPRA